MEKQNNKNKTKNNIKNNVSNFLKAENVIETIFYKNYYLTFRWFHFSRIFLLILIIFSLILFTIVYNLISSNQYRYLITDYSGKLIYMINLDQQNMDDQKIIEWTIDSVTRLYSFNYANYQMSFQNSKYNLTNVGWNGFEKAMTDSGSFNSIIKNKYVLTSVPAGPGKITGKKIFSILTDGENGEKIRQNRFGWRIEFPMLMTYRSPPEKNSKDNQANKVISQTVNMSIIIIRQPEFVQKDGLGISSIIIKN